MRCGSNARCACAGRNAARSGDGGNGIGHGKVSLENGGTPIKMKAAVRAAHAEIKAESICVASVERVEGVNCMVLEIVCAGRPTPILVPIQIMG